MHYMLLTKDSFSPSLDMMYCFLLNDYWKNYNMKNSDKNPNLGKYWWSVTHARYNSHATQVKELATLLGDHMWMWN
jgi:hypothetical protein